MKKTLINTNFSNTNSNNYITVNTFFRELTCTKYRREIYMTWDTLFSQFGGIFGLCLGGSVLSVVELIYIFTFKLWEYVRISRNNKNVKTFQIPIHNKNYDSNRFTKNGLMFNRLHYKHDSSYIYGNYIH